MIGSLPFLFAVFALFAGSAIAYLIGGSAIVGFIATDHSRFLAALPQKVFSQLDVFAFLAMPLFILAGDLMNRGGVTEALIRFSMSIMGRFKGGLGHVNIMTSVFFAGISGSATADAAALGNTLVPAMEKEGYPKDYAVAVTAASSIIGPIIPPSIILIFYGALMNTSVVALFAAGVLPGLLLALVLIVINALYAKAKDFPGGKGADLPAFWPALRHAIPALSLPVIMLSGILFGVMTPAEAAAVAVLAALVTGLIYKALSLDDIWQAAARTVMLTGAIFILLVAISVFGYLMSILQVPTKIASLLTDTGFTLTTYLIALNVIFLVAGMFMDLKAALALLAPILVPPAIAMGADPTHLGIVLGFNLAIGLITPPLGGVLLLLSTVCSINYWHLVRVVLPFLFGEVLLLIVLIAFPGISLYLPRLLGFIGG